MNLNQLYQLKHDITLNKGGTVNKTTVLAIIDSHIAALTCEEEQRQGDDVKTSQRSAQMPQTMPRIEQQTRHPPSREEVRKAYGH